MAAPEVLSIPTECSVTVAAVFRDVVAVAEEQRQGVRVFLLGNVDIGAQEDTPFLYLTHECQQHAVTAVHIYEAGIDDTESVYIVTASRDAVILWSLDTALLDCEDGRQPQPDKIISSGQGHVEAVACQGALLAACVGSDVQVWDVSSGDCAFVLSDHTAPVTAAAFSPFDQHVLASASEDRSFKLWDLQSAALLYKSEIVCAAALTAVAFNASVPRLSVGAADGVVRFYDVARPRAPRLLAALDVALALGRRAQAEAEAAEAAEAAAASAPKVIGSRGPTGLLKRGDSAGPRPAIRAPAPPHSELPRSIPVICFASVAAPASHRAAGGLLEAFQNLVVCTPHAVALADTRLLEVAQCSFLSADVLEPALVSAVAAGPSPAGEGAVRCALGQAGVSGLTVLDWACAEPAAGAGARGDLEADEVGEEDAAAGERAAEKAGRGAEASSAPPALSLFARAPLPPTSPLVRNALAPSTSRAPSAGSGAGRGAAGRGRLGGRGLVDRPITFHRTVKSSGYGAPPKHTAMFGAKKKPAPPRAARSQEAMAGGSGSVAGGELSDSPWLDCLPPTRLLAKESPPGAAPVRSTPVHRVAFSPDGGSVAACGTAGGARAQRFPPSRFGDEGASLWAGHSASVASLCWSACSSRVLTASADGTARLFAAGRADPLLVFSHLRRPPAPGDPPLPPSGGAASASAARANAPLGASVQAARFLAGDKAVVLAAGGRVLFYGYDLASLGSQADLRRARDEPTYKLLLSCATSAQQVNDIACLNAATSHLVIGVASNRSVEIIDAAVGKFARVIQDAHTRAPTRVVVPRGGLAGVPEEACDVFATAAADIDGGTIKLWDVRSQASVRRFSGHRNGSYPVGVAFSPCMRFVAAGSEDSTAYIFDLRQGAVLHRLQGAFMDVVSDVDFHPHRPILAASCLSGAVRYFGC